MTATQKTHTEIILFAIVTQSDDNDVSIDVGKHSKVSNDMISLEFSHKLLSATKAMANREIEKAELFWKT